MTFNIDTNATDQVSTLISLNIFKCVVCANLTAPCKTAFKHASGWNRVSRLNFYRHSPKGQLKVKVFSQRWLTSFFFITALYTFFFSKLALTSLFVLWSLIAMIYYPDYHFTMKSYQHVIKFQRSNETISHVVKREPYKHHSHV